MYLARSGLAVALLALLAGACSPRGVGGVDDAQIPRTHDLPPDAATLAPPAPRLDEIYGQQVPRSDSWWVGAGRLHFGADEVVLRGVNWFGLETPDRALHGLWTGNTIDDYLGWLTEAGFNALRLPVSHETIREGFPTAAWAQAVGLATGAEALDAALEATAAHDLYVLLDFHTCDSSLGKEQAPEPAACVDYDVAQWHADLRLLAQRVKGYRHVLGIDLFNEPHGPTWSAWAQLASDAGRAVLEENPRLLVFVEGVAEASDNGGWGAFWGENLVGAAAEPPDLPASRLVYSPHVYGPGVHPMPYFSAPGFPNQMPAIWDTHFGHLRDAGAAVVFGELGGWYDDDVQEGSVAWLDALVAYMVGRDMRSFFYWCLNPNSVDTGGLLAEDWVTPEQAKLQALAPLLP